MEATERLINRTRFRLMATAAAFSVAGLLVLMLVAPVLFAFGLKDTFATAPLIIAIAGFAGTIQIFLNEHWLHRMVWLAHPEGVASPRAEPLLFLLIKIGVAMSALSVPLLVAALVTFNVTPFDLILLGLEDLPDFLIADTLVCFALLGAFLLYRRVLHRGGGAAPAGEVGHLNKLMESVHSFSLQTSVVSLLLWALAGILAGWGCKFILHFSTEISAWVLGAVLALGLVVFPAQYYFFRKIFNPLGKQLIATAGEAYRVEGASAAGVSIDDEFVHRERLFTAIRLGIAIPAWGALALAHEAVEPFYIGLLVVYTLLVALSYAATYMPRFREAGGQVRLIADGFALTLFIQYSGSLTTVVGGLYYLLIYSIALHYGFERGLFFATAYSILYGGILLCEYVGWLPYAPAVIDGQKLLDILFYKSPWRHFHPSAPFLASFIAISAGMYLACFLARTFTSRPTDVRRLLDLD